MASSLSVNNHLVPRVSQTLVQKSAYEKPEENRQSLPEKVPQVLDLEASKLMEERLASRVQRGREQESYALQSRKAVSAYEGIAADEERDRVSGILGIDVFA